MTFKRLKRFLLLLQRVGKDEYGLTLKSWANIFKFSCYPKKIIISIIIIIIIIIIITIIIIIITVTSPS